jgi:hypothetical protein
VLKKYYPVEGPIPGYPSLAKNSGICGNFPGIFIFRTMRPVQELPAVLMEPMEVFHFGVNPGADA